MKNTFALLGMGLAAILLSSSAIAQKTKETKETRHIKMTKIENGKKMEIDTVLTGNDVFVWNGDTLNPAKHIKKFSPSGFDKMHNIDVKVDRKDGKEKVMIIKHKGGKAGEPMIWKMDTGDDMEIVTENIDSLGEKIVIRKRMKDGADRDHMIFFKDGDMKHFPPMPPMPPMRHMKMMTGANSGRVIDLNDPKIISYKKKNMSGNREKIEIIREKSEDPENMTFDFEVGDELMAPEAPVNVREFEDNNRKMKITEKDIELNGKKAKEIKVEVESEENK